MKISTLLRGLDESKLKHAIDANNELKKGPAIAKDLNLRNNDSMIRLLAEKASVHKIKP